MNWKRRWLYGQDSHAGERVSDDDKLPRARRVNTEFGHVAVSARKNKDMRELGMIAVADAHELHFAARLKHRVDGHSRRKRNDCLMVVRVWWHLLRKLALHASESDSFLGISLVRPYYNIYSNFIPSQTRVN